MRSNARSIVRLSLIAAIHLAVLAGCSTYDVIPDSLKGQVNHDLTFDQIRASPSQFKGEVVVLGGEVLSATRLQDKTRIEVMAVPLSDDLIPMVDQSGKTGRFYAFDSGKVMLDPAVLQPGTPVTIVGEVLGSTTGQIDEASYEFPTVLVKDLTKWEEINQPRMGYRYPYYGGHYWAGMRPWGPYPFY